MPRKDSVSPSPLPVRPLARPRRRVVRRVTVTDDKGHTFQGRLLLPARARGQESPDTGRHPVADSIGALAGFPAWAEFLAILEENRRRENEAVAQDGAAPAS